MRAAKEAGALIRNAFSRTDKQIEQKKNASDLVTETDIQVQSNLLLGAIPTQIPCADATESAACCEKGPRSS